MSAADWAERCARLTEDPPVFSRRLRGGGETMFSGRVGPALCSVAMAQGTAARAAKWMPCHGDLTVTTGVIRRLVEYRGLGFVQSNDGRRVFFHRSAVQHVSFGELQEGQAVEFEVEDTPQGPKARRVYVITATQRTPPRPHT
jgi:CspA family cold shock protein